MVELALSTPLLIVLVAGVVDFARLFYMTMELTNAARAGAQAGSIAASGFTAADVQAVAAAASPRIAPYTVPLPTQSCFCIPANATALGASHSCTTVCATSTDYLATYVTVSATKQFAPIIRFPGVPGAINVTRTVRMRAQ